MDMHTHIFPGKIVERAVESISDFYGLSAKETGTLEDLLKVQEDAGIIKSLVHSTATKPEQVTSINDFIASVVKDREMILGFGTLHPDFDNIESEVQRIRDLGLLGIKLHPDFQRFNIDDPKAFRLYKACEGVLPILFHMGDNRMDYSSPIRLCKILDKFPNLIVIAAHLGGYNRWADAFNYVAGSKNVYLDTSSSVGIADRQLAISIIEKHGTDKVFFASDYPMWQPKEEIRKLEQLLEQMGLGEEEKDKIFFKNAERFLSSITQ